MAHVSECGLVAGQKPTDAFTAGQGECPLQPPALCVWHATPTVSDVPTPCLVIITAAVVKCRVLSADPTAKKGLKLSLVSKKKAAPAADAAGAEADAAAAPAATGAQEEGAAPATSTKRRTADQAAEGELLPACFQAGDVVHGTVTAIHSSKGEGTGGESVPTYLELEVAVPAGEGDSAPAAAAVVQGRLDVAHLADHPVAVAALLAAVKVGSSLGPLLVLQRLEVSGWVAAAAWECMQRLSSSTRQPFDLPGPSVACFTRGALSVRLSVCRACASCA